MTNRKTIFLTLLLSVLFITFYTFYRIHKNTMDLTIKVAENKILYGAMNCFWEDACSEKVTLKELKELGYLKDVVNPITKMYYNENSYVEKKGDLYHFHEVTP